MPPTKKVVWARTVIVSMGNKEKMKITKRKGSIHHKIMASGDWLFSPFLSDWMVCALKGTTCPSPWPSVTRTRALPTSPVQTYMSQIYLPNLKKLICSPGFHIPRDTVHYCVNLKMKNHQKLPKVHFDYFWEFWVDFCQKKTFILPRVVLLKDLPSRTTLGPRASQGLDWGFERGRKLKNRKNTFFDILAVLWWSKETRKQIYFLVSTCFRREASSFSPIFSVVFAFECAVTAEFFKDSLDRTWKNCYRFP